ncbi:MAG: hypothetical protein QOE26_260 [Verrucomicrobiota bacterium]|jgi:hypothetical protein
MSKDPWYSSDNAEKAKRQKAANQFLRDTLKNPDDQNSLYQNVLNDANVAREKFAEYYKAVTGIDLPDAVKVTCYEEHTESAANLVAIMLPPKSTPIDTPDLWVKSWLAAWPPYPPQPGTDRS